MFFFSPLSSFIDLIQFRSNSPTLTPSTLIRITREAESAAAAHALAAESAAAIHGPSVTAGPSTANVPAVQGGSVRFASRYGMGSFFFLPFNVIILISQSLPILLLMINDEKFPDKFPGIPWNKSDELNKKAFHKRNII